MLASLQGVVLIDDTQEDLDELQKSLFRVGYPCLPIKYDNSDPGNVSGIDHVNLERVNSRVIITDLNLQELQVDAKNLVAPIAEVLKTLNPLGPYILFFWSKNSSQVEGVMELLAQRYYQEVPLPLYWGVLDKAEFKGNESNLSEKVKSLIEEGDIFHAVCNWENKVSNAAQGTINSLYQLARPKPEEVTGDSFFRSKVKENLQNMLAIIGNETLGQKNAKDTPGVAIELGLEPVLHNHLRDAYEPTDGTMWGIAVPNVGKKVMIHADLKAHLNSFYHIDDSLVDNSVQKRGTWVALSPEYFDDAKKQSKVKENFGKDLKVILNEEFLNCAIGTKDERQKVRESLKIGFLELSAECDQAQRKTKFHRYFLSVLIPIEHISHTYFRDNQSNVAHAGIYRLPQLIINGKEYIVKVSFMYHIGVVPSSCKWLGKAVFRLKDQILTEITFKASQHSSRPGIVSFN
ncbi:hypothetical protein [Reinekea sp. G2M2-21]|uniref:hypothetical protein n=1 Tax=Reinekea sp. G2M2-21 TaxID=2788942 RepID=UPI0018AA744F|nr:hypothetical protein [Reinekea sp. G2M2-21]